MTKKQRAEQYQQAPIAPRLCTPLNTIRRSLHPGLYHDLYKKSMKYPTIPERKKLFKTTKDISKGLKSQFEEVPTAQNTLIWMKDHNFSELKYIKYI